MRRLLAVTMMLGAVSVPLPARSATGNELLADCQQEGGSFKSGYCMGYIVGSTEMSQAILAIGNKRWFCAPQNVTQGQLERVTVKYLEDNPAKTADPAAFLMLSALVDAFPCPKKE